MSTAVTTGFHRIGNVTTRAPQGIYQQAVPGASVYVTATSTGVGATIYSDPELSVSISGSLLTADETGAYDYYIPLNYSVTETVSSPNNGLVVLSNVVQNGPLVGVLTTTANTTDTVSIAGILSTSHVAMQPTNASAATMYGSTYVSAKSAGSITVTHPATSGATFDIIITPY
jgi:hypothetical protein